MSIKMSDINNLKRKVQLKRDEIMQAKGNRAQLLKESEAQIAQLKEEFGITPDEIESTLEKIQETAREDYERVEEIVSEWED